MTHSLTSSDIKQFQSYLMDSNVKLNTAKKYVRDVKKLAHFLADQTQTLSQNSLDAFLKSLPEAGYEARSINSIIASIKSYCKFAGRTDLQCKSLNIRIVVDRKPPQLLLRLIDQVSVDLLRKRGFLIERLKCLQNVLFLVGKIENESIHLAGAGAI